MNGFFDGVDIDTYLAAIGTTLFMTVVSMVVAGIVGLLLGVALYATRRGNIFENKLAFGVIGFVVNLIRPIPFVILLATLFPVQQLVVGTSIGTPAATFTIAFAAGFAVARIVEQSLVAIDPGVVEAARAAGASRLSILFTVVVPEGLGPLVLGYTFIFIGIVDMTAQAGIIGGGGLGDYAITSGSQRYDYGVVIAAVIAIVVIVQIGQLVGNRVARGVMRR